MKKTKFLLLLLLAFLSGNAQENTGQKVIGFTCCNAEKQSKPVKYVTGLMLDGHFKAIVKLLHSENPAENFLAVIACEKLEEKGFIVLNAKKRKRITGFYQDKTAVSVCSGCTFSGSLTLSDMLRGKDTQHLRKEAEYWADETIAQLKALVPASEETQLKSLQGR